MLFDRWAMNTDTWLWFDDGDQAEQGHNLQLWVSSINPETCKKCLTPEFGLLVRKDLYCQKDFRIFATHHPPSEKVLWTGKHPHFNMETTFKCPFVICESARRCFPKEVGTSRHHLQVLYSPFRTLLTCLHTHIFSKGVVHRVEIGWGLTKVMAAVLLNGLLW